MKVLGSSHSRALLITGLFIVCTLYVTLQASAYRGGITGVTNKAGNRSVGCTCHCPTADTTTYVFFAAAVPDTTYVAGGTYQFTVTVFNEAESRAGVNVAAWKGTLSTAAYSPLGVNSGQLYQTAPQNLKAGAYTWTFKYKAPATGVLTDTLYASGNAVNGDGSEDGDCSDLWNVAPKFVINIQPAKGVEQPTHTYDKLQVAPNPSDKLARFTVTLDRSSEGSVEIIDVAGRTRSLTSTHFSNGKNALSFSTASLPNGIYFARLRIGEKIIATTKLSVQH